MSNTQSSCSNPLIDGNVHAGTAASHLRAELKADDARVDALADAAARFAEAMGDVLNACDDAERELDRTDLAWCHERGIIAAVRALVEPVLPVPPARE